MTAITTDAIISPFVPEDLFGEDHVCALDYVRTVIAECSGFQIGFDGLMRSNSANFEKMQRGCPRPKRIGYLPSKVEPITRTYYTELRNGKPVTEHDDWECLRDMAAAGYFTHGPDDLLPGTTIHLSARGREIVQCLARHLRMGGKIRTFVIPLVDQPLCA